MRSHLFIRRHVEQQVRLDEGLGILMKEGYLLRRETFQETVVWGKGQLIPQGCVEVVTHTTN